MQKKSVAYFSKMYQAVPVIAPLQREIGGVFVTGRKSTMKAFEENFAGLPVRRYQKFLPRISSGHRVLENAEIIFTGSPYRSFLESYEAKKYMVFHGTYMMMSKDTTDKLVHFDRLFLTGPRMKQMFSRAALEIETRETGYIPFADFPQRNESGRREVLLRLGLNPELQTIVYTPSRSKIGSWLECSAALARSLPEKFNLVMRPHPSQALNAEKQDRESYEQVKAIMAGSQNAVLDLITCSLPEVLSVADLVISDANSPAEESMFYDVPQLFIETDRFSREHLRRMGVEQEMHPQDLEQLLTLFECGATTGRTDDWVSVAQRAIDDQQQFSGARDRYFSWVFGQRDRDAAKRVAQNLN